MRRSRISFPMRPRAEERRFAHASEAAGQYAHQVGDGIRQRYDNAEACGPSPPGRDSGRGLRHRPGGRADRRVGDAIPVSALLNRSSAQERHLGQSTQVPDGPSGRRDLPRAGGHRRDVARGRGAQAPGSGGAPQFRTGAACRVLRAPSVAAGDCGHPHGRPRARDLERDRLRRRPAALHAGLRTAELSEGNPEEGEFPEAVRRHCAASCSASRRRRGQVVRHAGR